MIDLFFHYHAAFPWMPSIMELNNSGTEPTSMRVEPLHAG